MTRRDFLASTSLAVVPAIAGPIPSPASPEPYPHGMSIAMDQAAYRPDLPQEAELLHMIHYTLVACHEALAAHGDGCPCNLCHDLRGLAFNLETGLSFLASNLHTQAGDVVDCPCCGQRWDDDAEAA